MRMFDSLTKFDVLNEIVRFYGPSSCDVDANFDTNINCKYYT